MGVNRTVVTGTAGALLVLVLCVACGPEQALSRSPHHRLPRVPASAPSRQTTPPTKPVAPSTTRSTTTLPTPTTTTTTNPAGALPQTTALPPATSPQFEREMSALWSAIKTGETDPAMAAFFPEAAYDQVKALSDPTSDFLYRLVAEFDSDIQAAHDYLGGQAAAAKLAFVAVDENEVAWIPPGYCTNKVGYWHAPGARLVYEEGGEERSIGIASLISWRGEWYIVHLGAVLRGDQGGVVDSPSLGEGEFAPPGGC
ncbi:MAG: hypothetical protein ACRDZP_02350 [Acidimicrobiales bacterium]